MKQLRYEVGLWSASSSEVIAVYSYTILQSFTFSCHGTVLITGTTLLLWKRTNMSLQQNMHTSTRIKLTRVHCLSFSTAPVFFLISKIEYIYLNSSYILFNSNFISHYVTCVGIVRQFLKIQLNFVITSRKGLNNLCLCKQVSF